MKCPICGIETYYPHDHRWPVLDLHAEIAKQRHEGQFVVAPLSMLRCSECGELLDSFGCCVVHGLLDTEALDGYDEPPDTNREGDPAFNGAFNRW